MRAAGEEKKMLVAEKCTGMSAGGGLGDAPMKAITPSPEEGDGGSHASRAGRKRA
jgi:hypothetical protein